jgi:hypothetical protein
MIANDPVFGVMHVRMPNPEDEVVKKALVESIAGAHKATLTLPTRNGPRTGRQIRR